MNSKSRIIFCINLFLQVALFSSCSQSVLWTKEFRDSVVVENKYDTRVKLDIYGIEKNYDLIVHKTEEIDFGLVSRISKFEYKNHLEYWMNSKFKYVDAKNYDFKIVTEIISPSWRVTDEKTNFDYFQGKRYDLKTYEYTVDINFNTKIINKKGETVYQFNDNAIGIGSQLGEASNTGIREAKKTALWRAVRSAVENYIVAMQKDLAANDKIALYEKEAREAKSLPSDLILLVKYDDSKSFLPNNTLDAGEDAELIVVAKNNGKGAGYGTVLEVSSDNPKISFGKEIQVGDIQPGEEKEIKVTLKAALDIADAKTSIQLNLNEKRGYDARKVVYQLKTARLERPKLEIVSTEINDGNTGLAKGNGNGIPESGETVELTAYIRNTGAGKAVGVNLTGENSTSGVKWAQNSTLVGTIPPGETVKAKLAFTIPISFDAREIASNLKVSDIRGVNDTERKVALPFGRLSPDIQSAWRIYSKGTPVYGVTNGEEYEFEVALSNNGGISARGVTINLAADGGMIFSRSRIQIGEIKEQTKLPGQRVNLSVPRTYTEGRALLTVEVTQADFPTKVRSVDIPVNVISPKLKYLATLRSKSGGATLEQGERATLELQVVNEGNLPAEGVRVKIGSMDDNLKLQEKSEEYIGTVSPLVPSGTVKFQISTTKRIKPGPAVLNVSITQSDFGPFNEQYALNIREERADVIDVAAEESTKSRTVTGGVGKATGPAITVKTRIAETGEESVRLVFDVVDGATNIDASSVKVTVNGAVVPLGVEAGLTTRPEKRKQVLAEIPLREGENRIVITARNVDYIQASREYTITRTGEEDVDRPPVTGAKNPDAVAVVIGISKYSSKDIPSVDYARRDAEAVKKYFVQALGISESRIMEAYDEEATFGGLRSLFGGKLSRMVDPQKTDIFVYYSGHGVPDAARKPYFVPYDADPDLIQDTGYPLNTLYERLKTLRAKSVTVIIDACFSGGTEGGKNLVKGISPISLEVDSPAMAIPNGMVFTSSSGRQVSSWYPKKEHGLFTYYFLLGMKGAADADKNGRVTVEEMETYLSKNVTAQAWVLKNREQTPQVMGVEKGRVLMDLNR